MTVPTAGEDFAGYGIYPQYKEFYALHMFFDIRATRKDCETFLKERFEIVQPKVIPTRKIPAITDEPLIWRYFVSPIKSAVASMQLDEKEFVAGAVMKIDAQMPGVYVFSSGKSMGAFKAVGFPEDVGVFYRLEEYESQPVPAICHKNRVPIHNLLKQKRMPIAFMNIL